MPFVPITTNENWISKPCRHPEHDPPSHICIPPGEVRKWQCPACGVETYVFGAYVHCRSNEGSSDLAGSDFPDPYKD